MPDGNKPVSILSEAANTQLCARVHAFHKSMQYSNAAIRRRSFYPSDERIYVEITKPLIIPDVFAHKS